MTDVTREGVDEEALSNVAYEAAGICDVDSFDEAWNAYGALREQRGRELEQVEARRTLAGAFRVDSLESALEHIKLYLDSTPGSLKVIWGLNDQIAAALARAEQAEAQRDRLLEFVEHTRRIAGRLGENAINTQTATEAQAGGVAAEHSDLEWITLCAGDILAAIQLASDGEYTLREFLIDAGRSCSRLGDHISAIKAAEQARKEAQG